MSHAIKSSADLARGHRVFVIAEAGVNHNGSLDLAHQLVDVASRAGADAIKFQTFSADSLLAVGAPKAEYQVARTAPGESQFEMIRGLELSNSAHFELAEECRRKKLEFLSTPFDERSLDFLVDEIGLDTIKIASGELVNGPFLLHAARKSKKIILSTGMSTLAEVELAIAVLAFGAAHPTGVPMGRNWQDALLSDGNVHAALRDRLTILHCTTEYPAPYADMNLLAMDTLFEQFKFAVGLSDHSRGFAMSIAAAARKASVIEKHFTLDPSLPGPDHAASLDPSELAEMIAGIRAVEAALGDGVKRPAPSEVKNLSIARKSIVAAREIQVGEIFDASSLAAKRTGGGRSPMEIWDLLGQASDRHYLPDDVIR